MPSPFPGMDPYLEGNYWTSFHTLFATEIARQLAPKLRPKYVAMPEKRFDIVDEGSLAIEAVYPDVSISSGKASEDMRAAAAVASAPFLLQTVMEESAPHTWIEIRDAASRRLVTTVEILSPWNKRGMGREEYLGKRRKLLHSSSHLIEIDLLRRGHRLPMKDTLPAGAYYVFVSRVRTRPMLEVWPIGLHESLPTIPVPLLPGDDDVALDLQAAFQNAYDSASFDLVLDYNRPPELPLSAEQTAWLAERLDQRSK